MTARLRVLRQLAALSICIGTPASAARVAEIETLTAVGALPAHIAGAFQQLTSCQQTAGGDYFIFDRRSHAVFVAPAEWRARAS
jgi:hypothetical protein